MPWGAGTTDWPTANDANYGSGLARVDGMDTVWARDINFLYTQTEEMQKFAGNSGQRIGEQQGATEGPGGLESPNDPVAAVGINLATKDEYIGAAGFDVFRVTDDINWTGAGPKVVLAVDQAGILSTYGGIDIGSTEYLEIPHGAALPATFEEGRIFRLDTTEVIYHADGAGWNALTGAEIAPHGVVVGNAVSGDTTLNCDYLDVGDGVGIEAALLAAATDPDAPKDVFIKRGIYDLGAGAATPPFVVPSNIHVRGAGRGMTQITTKTDGGFQGAFQLSGSNSTLQDLTIYVPGPINAVGPGTLNVVSIEGGYNCCQRVDVNFDAAGWAIALQANAILRNVFSTGVVGVSAAYDVKLVDCIVGGTGAAPSYIGNGYAPGIELNCFRVNTGGGVPTLSATIDRCVSYGGDIGALVDVVAHVTNCDLALWYSRGITLAGANSSKSLVHGNQIVGAVAGVATAVGILLDTNVNQCGISQNHLELMVAAVGQIGISLISAAGNAIVGNRGAVAQPWTVAVNIDNLSTVNEVMGQNFSGSAPIINLGAGNDVAHNL